MTTAEKYGIPESYSQFLQITGDRETEIFDMLRNKMELTRSKMAETKFEAKKNSGPFPYEELGALSLEMKRLINAHNNMVRYHNERARSIARQKGYETLGTYIASHIYDDDDHPTIHMFTI